MSFLLLRQRAVALLTVLAACGLLSDDAHAQFGGLRRAAERRVEKTAEQRAADRITAATLIPPAFDGRTVELTAERLDRYTAAMETRKITLAANRQRYDAMQAEIRSLKDAAQRADNSRERDTFSKDKDRYSECRNGIQEAMEAESERQVQVMTQRMISAPGAAQRDPKVREMIAAVTAATTAQQAGDSVATRRAAERLARAFGMEMDSAALDRKAIPKCGARPAKPRSMVVSDSLVTLANAKETEANALVGATGGVKGREVGMTDEQARTVWERIQSWLNGVQDSAPITRTFTRAEYDLLVARRNSLRKAFANSE